MNYFQGVRGLFEMLGLYKEHSFISHLKSHVKEDELYPFGVKNDWKISSLPFLDHVFSLSLLMKNSEMLLAP